MQLYNYIRVWLSGSNHSLLYIALSSKISHWHKIHLSCRIFHSYSHSCMMAAIKTPYGHHHSHIQVNFNGRFRLSITSKPTLGGHQPWRTQAVVRSLLVYNMKLSALRLRISHLGAVDCSRKCICWANWSSQQRGSPTDWGQPGVHICPSLRCWPGCEGVCPWPFKKCQTVRKGIYSPLYFWAYNGNTNKMSPIGTLMYPVRADLIYNNSIPSIL